MNPGQKTIQELRRSLATLMSEYSKIFEVKKEELLQRLYKKYKVKSRKELTREQLILEIHSYDFSLKFWVL